MADEGSFVDRMAENEPVSLNEEDVVGTVTPDAEGTGADDGAPPTTAAPAPDTSATNARLDKLEESLFQAKQEAAYWRGQAARDKQPETKPAEAPKAEYDDAAFDAEFDANPREAIKKAMRAMARDESRKTGTEVEGRVAGQLTGTQRQQELRTALEREGQEVIRDYGDLVSNDASGKPLNAEFSQDCWDYAQNLARSAGNPVIQSGPNAGAYVLMPGQMRAAADAVYGKWSRANKLPAAKAEAAAPASEPRSLRTLIDQVPRTDNLGNGKGLSNGRANGLPKSIEDLANTDYFGAGDKSKHIKAARNMCRQMGWNEAEYVKNAIASSRNGEIDA